MPRREPDHSFDLHGLTRDQAIRETHQRLLRIRAGGGRSLVEIVTGKGEHSPDGRPVIGPAVKEWLEGDGRRLVDVRHVQWGPGGGVLLVQIGYQEEGN